MKLPLDILSQKYIKPKIYLCDVDKKRICQLNTTDTKATLKFNAYSELSFGVGRVYNDFLTGETKVNPHYDKIEAVRLIELGGFGYFEIQGPEITGDGIKEVKNVTAYSLEYTLSQKYLSDFVVNTGEIGSVEVTYAEDHKNNINSITPVEVTDAEDKKNDIDNITPVTLYNPKCAELSLLHLVLKSAYGWKIGHVDASLQTLSRKFEVDRQSVYDFLMNEVCQSFNCYIVFDTYNNEINVYAESLTAKFLGDGKSNAFVISPPFSEVATVSIDGYKTTRWEYDYTNGQIVLEDTPKDCAHIEVIDGAMAKWETDVFVGFHNLSQEVNVSYDADEIKTQLTINYGDGGNIREVNLGLPYIIDLSYYLTPEWMGESLYTKWIEYQRKCDEKVEEYAKNSEDMLYWADKISYEEYRTSSSEYAEVSVTSDTVGTYYVRGGNAPNFYYTSVSLPSEYNAETTYYHPGTTNIEHGGDGNVKLLFTVLQEYYYNFYHFLTEDENAELYQSYINGVEKALENINELSDSFNFTESNADSKHKFSTLNENLNSYYKDDGSIKSSTDPSINWKTDRLKEQHLGDLWKYTGNTSKVNGVMRTKDSKWIWSKKRTKTGVTYQWESITTSLQTLDKVDAYVSDFLEGIFKEVGRTPLKELYYKDYKQVEIVQIDSGWSQAGHDNHSKYLLTHVFLLAIEDAIKELDNIIKGHEEKYNEAIQRNADITDELLIENNFAEYELIKLNAFLREDELQLDDIVETSQDSTADYFKTKQDAMDSGRIELQKLSQPRLQFSMTMANIYALPEFEPIIDQFQLGNVIKVAIRDGYIKQSRLLGVNINFDDFSDFSCDFGDLTSLRTQSDIHADLLSQAVSAGKTVAQYSGAWTRGSDQVGLIDLRLQEGLLNSIEALKSTDATQSASMDKYGIHLEKVDPETGEIDDERIWMVNNQIVFTDDGFKTSKAVLGKFTVGDEERYGLLADAVIAGVVEGSIIVGGEIYSDNYSATDNNKQGSYINLRNGTFDFGGGRIIYNGDSVVLSGVSINWESSTLPPEAEVKIDDIEGLADYLNQIGNIQEQVDGRAETWYQDTDPSDDWKDDNTKQLHIGDLWHYTGETGEVSGIDRIKNSEWVWTAESSSKYSWSEIDISDEVFDTIDTKAYIFTSQPVPPYNIGDLWVQGANGDILHCVTARNEGASYNANDWKKSSKYTDNTELNNFISGDYATSIQNIQGQVDKKAETWYQATDPSVNWQQEAIDKTNSSYIGKIWKYTGESNKLVNGVTRPKNSLWVWQKNDSGNYEWISTKSTDAVTWSQDTDPSVDWQQEQQDAVENANQLHLGDLWKYTGNTGKVNNVQRGKNSEWIWQKSNNTYSWSQMEVPDEVFDTIDKVASIYVVIPTSPNVGDLLIPEKDIIQSGKTYKAGKVYKWTGSSWSEIGYTDDTTATAAKGIAENAKTIGDTLVTGLGFQETEITGEYIISPVIAGGTVLIGDQNGTYAQITTEGKLICKGAEIAGSITAQSGKIANFEIADSEVPSNGFWNYSLSAVNSSKGDDGKYRHYVTFMRNSGKNTTVAFGVKETKNTYSNAYKAGDVDWNSEADYKFSVTHSGKLFATEAEIAGKITATSLTLGDGVTIPEDKVPELNFYIKQDGTIGSTPAEGATGFNVSSKGLLTASNAVIYGTVYASAGKFTGSITADSGKIADWDISGSKLYVKKTNSYNGVGMNAGKGAGQYVFWAGYTGAGEDPWYEVNDGDDKTSPHSVTAFYVTNAGYLKASNANITGAITATSLTLAEGVTIGVSSIKGLSQVATDGNYNSLSNKPKIPQSVADLNFDTSNIIYKGDITQSEKKDSNGNTYIETTVPTTSGKEITYSTYNAEDYIVFGRSKGTNSIGQNYVCISKTGLLTARNALIYGTIYATDGEFFGKVTADSGKIANWTISGTKLYVPKNSTNAYGIGMNASGSDNAYAFWAGYNGAGETPWDDSNPHEVTNFIVKTDGYLKASNAHITGTIQANSLIAKNCYYICDNDFGVSNQKIISCVEDNTSDTDFRFGRLASNGWNNGAKNYIEFRDKSDTRECHINSGSFYVNCDLYATNIIRTEGSMTFGYGKGTTERGIWTYWADESPHYIVSRGENGLTCGLGWAGNENYPTVTILRGQTCKYSNSSGNTTLSDERLKHDFNNLDSWENFYNTIEPVAFKMNAGTSNRYHIGFKAQQIESALLNNKLTTQDFGGLVKSKYVKDVDDILNAKVYEEAGINDGDEEYGLIYTEFIALNTHMIQKNIKEIESLKQQIEELKATIEKLSS